MPSLLQTYFQGKNRAGANADIPQLPLLGQAPKADSLPMSRASDDPPVDTYQVWNRAVAEFNRPADTTAYALDSIMHTSKTLATAQASGLPFKFNVGRVAGKAVAIQRVGLAGRSTMFNGAPFRVQFFNGEPTIFGADGAPWAKFAGEDLWLGYAEVVLNDFFTQTSPTEDWCKGYGSMANGVPIIAAPADGIVRAVLHNKMSVASVAGLSGVKFRLTIDYAWVG